MHKYIVDTNIFRDASAPGNDEATKTRRKQAKEFFRKMVDDEKAILLIPDEVKLELMVQMVAKGLRTSEMRKIARLINQCTQSSSKLSSEMEQHLRLMSAFISKHYREKFEQETGVKAEYLRTSDARILYNAFFEEGIIATRNVKDFLLYLVLNDFDEEVLYNIGNSNFVRISAELHETIHQDTRFSNLLSNFIRLAELQDE
ncbi:DUF4411 family protein [Exiguobacterium sp. TNDT2]|uniref:DUF4411 family protein n=1 Tax=Exiguobacterium sp. TNDT2 TaxID=2233531 RepID=UPI0013004F54|nr:DUF4411 family protein [Exiguobacterium sp. TNDT2]